MLASPGFSVFSCLAYTQGPLKNPISQGNLNCLASQYLTMAKPRV
jgi:hypothetical protein